MYLLPHLILFSVNFLMLDEAEAFSTVAPLIR